MAAPKEIGRKPNGMGECRPSCGCVKTTSWKYHSARSTFSSKSSVHQISAVPSKTAERSVLYTNISSISQSQQGEDRSVVCAWGEIPRLLLLCDERQMPTLGTSKVQSQNEVKVERTDKSQQRMGICQEEAKAERIHKRLGRLLSSC